jgi:hypothetical protein
MHIVLIKRTFGTVGTIWLIPCQFNLQVPFSALPSPVSENLVCMEPHNGNECMQNVGLCIWIIFEVITISKYQLTVKCDFWITNFVVLSVLLNIQSWAWLSVTAMKWTLKWCHYHCIRGTECTIWPCDIFKELQFKHFEKHFQIST